MPSFTPGSPVFGEGGLRGSVVGTLPGDGAVESAVLVEVEGGGETRVPASTLRPLADGEFFLPLGGSDLEGAQNASGVLPDVTAEAILTVPVVAETLRVHKQVVGTGRARITKRVVEREEVVDEPLLREEVAVERVSVNRPWEGPPPPVRYEGERMVIPLLEEVLVVEKRLVLKEELHVWRVRKTVHEPQSVTLRSEEVTVERVGPQAGAADTPVTP